MELTKLSNADKIEYGKNVEIYNSRRTGKIEVKWIGKIHEASGCGIRGRYYAFKRGSKLGIAYVDDEQLEVMDTEIFAEEMGIKIYILKTLANAENASYEHLVL